MSSIPVGIHNQYNDCWLISLFQCIYHSPYYRDVLSHHLPTTTCSHWISALRHGPSTLNVTRLKEEIGLTGKSQQDPSEAFVFLCHHIPNLQPISFTMLVTRFANIRKPITNLDVTPPGLTDQEWTNRKQNHKLFGYHRALIYQNTINQETILRLHLPSSITISTRVTLTDLLKRHYFSRQHRPGDDEREIICGLDQQKQWKAYEVHSCLSQVYIDSKSEPPPALILQIARWTDTRRKLNVKIHDIDLSFDLRPYVKLTEKFLTNQPDHVCPPMIYELCAFLNHRGQGMTSGHYVAYVNTSKRGTTPQHQRWYCCNDNIITPITLHEIRLALEDGYVLFYERGQLPRQFEKMSINHFSKEVMDPSKPPAQ